MSAAEIYCITDKVITDEDVEKLSELHDLVIEQGKLLVEISTTQKLLYEDVKEIKVEIKAHEKQLNKLSGVGSFLAQWGVSIFSLISTAGVFVYLINKHFLV